MHSSPTEEVGGVVNLSGTTPASIPGIVFNLSLVRLATGKSSTTSGPLWSQLCTKSPHTAAITDRRLTPNVCDRSSILCTA
ncbi:hypothetical protein NIIDMKKI_01010 [Mycobacterium kansasii]|uniref:Uncharacterized protein n=1 Tax=Mycobacterium kansasii TaxID=1768 RepID=A0A7G1I4U9_MYCKA|nr:hypothetical protein NIIDMKKI_01010 [Mycobacterium kansasii]